MGHPSSLLMEYLCRVLSPTLNNILKLLRWADVFEQREGERMELMSNGFREGAACLQQSTCASYRELGTCFAAELRSQARSSWIMLQYTHFVALLYCAILAPGPAFLINRPLRCGEYCPISWLTSFKLPRRSLCGLRVCAKILHSGTSLQLESALVS